MGPACDVVLSPGYPRGGSVAKRNRFTATATPTEPSVVGIDAMRRSLTLFVGLVATACTGIQNLGPSWLPYLLEALLLASALATVWFGWAQERFSGLSTGHKLACGLLPFLLCLGIVAKSPRALHPFLSWGMFGRSPQGELVQYRVFAHDGAGEHRLMPAIEVSDVASSSIDRHLRERFERAWRSGSDDDIYRALSVLLGVVRVHERYAGHGLAHSVSIERCSSPAQAPSRMKCSARQQWMRSELSVGASER